MKKIVLKISVSFNIITETSLPENTFMLEFGAKLRNDIKSLLNTETSQIENFRVAGKQF